MYAGLATGAIVLVYGLAEKPPKTAQELATAFVLLLIWAVAWAIVEDTILKGCD